MEQLVQQFEELKITAASKYADNDPSVKELIETYLKVVLSCTFYYENYLTENNFRLESSTQDVDTIVHLLNSTISICSSVDRNFLALEDSKKPIIETYSSYLNSKCSHSNPLISVVNVLGFKFAECILWRQGSILYAFCCVKLTSDPEWVDNYQINLLNYLKDGVKYFHTLLNLKNEIKLVKPDDDQQSSQNFDLKKFITSQFQGVIQNLETNESADDEKMSSKHQCKSDHCLNQQDKSEKNANNDSVNAFEDSKIDETTDINVDTLELIEMGIKSDTYLLAMMYCGEMCFWYCKYSLEWQLLDLEEDKEIFGEMKTLGVNYLNTYVKAVEKILHFAGWNCERAKELLNLFPNF